MINTLYWSTVNYDWPKDHSVLLDSNSLKKIIYNDKLIDCHTSIQDITTSNIQLVISEAKKIILIDFYPHLMIDPSKYDDDFYSIGRLLYELLKVKNKVSNFELINEINVWTFDDLVSSRKTNDNILWTAGCSVTFGDGVVYEQRYGSLLAKQMQMPEISLSKPGSSMMWTADQILRSDIRMNDIVVWGLTTFDRFEYSEQWKLHSNTIANGIRLKLPMDYDINYNTFTTHSPLHYIRTLRSIFQVINFCQKIGARLYLVNLLEITWLPVIFREYSNFLDCTRYSKIKDIIEFVDLGTDGLHPGPKQHQIYAEQILKLIKENNHG